MHPVKFGAITRRLARDIQDCSNTPAKFGAITRLLAREPERNVSRMFLVEAAIILTRSGRQVTRTGGSNNPLLLLHCGLDPSHRIQYSLRNFPIPLININTL